MAKKSNNTNPTKIDSSKKMSIEEIAAQCALHGIDLEGLQRNNTILFNMEEDLRIVRNLSLALNTMFTNDAFPCENQGHVDAAWELSAQVYDYAKVLDEAYHRT